MRFLRTAPHLLRTNYYYWFSVRAQKRDAMAFSQKDYVFSHTINNDSKPHQPAAFPIDLSDLITPFGECSPMFAIDSMSVTAYKRDTWEEVPVKFAVLNTTKTRALTNDPGKLSSKWNVELGSGRSVKIAGTDKTPFRHSLSVCDVDNRQGLLNVLAFMMTESVWASDGTKGLLERLKAECSDTEFFFTCARCKTKSSACVTASVQGQPVLHLRLCTDRYVCVPDEATRAQLKSSPWIPLIELIYCAYRDDLEIVRRATARFADNTACPRQRVCDYLYPGEHGVTISIPYQLVDFIVSFYQTLSEYADGFAVVRVGSPHVKVLIESPSENVGHITGALTVTVLYGTSVHNIHQNMRVEALDDGEELNLDAAMLQFGYDTLIKRFPLGFDYAPRDVPLIDWCRFYHEKTAESEIGPIAPSPLLHQMHGVF